MMTPACDTLLRVLHSGISGVVSYSGSCKDRFRTDKEERFFSLGGAAALGFGSQPRSLYLFFCMLSPGPAVLFIMQTKPTFA